MYGIMISVNFERLPIYTEYYHYLDSVQISKYSDKGSS